MLTEDIFKKICKEKKKSQVSAARLTKGKLLAFLSRRYKGSVAKIIAQYFDFSTHYDYETFIEEIETFMNFKRETLLKIAFQIYDYDQDHFICNLDMYTFLKNYEHDEDCFFKAYSGDIAVIENEIHEKRKKMGLDDAEVKFKLRDIDNKLRELGGRLEVALLDNFNVPGEDGDDSDRSDPSEAANSDKDGVKSVAGRSRMGKSTRSRRSKSSRRSRMSQSRRSLGASSKGSRTDGDDNDRHEKEHPYDKIFSKSVTRNIKKSTVHMTRLTLNDFKQIEFEPYFPSVILDLIEYLSGYRV